MSATILITVRELERQIEEFLSELSNLTTSSTGRWTKLDGMARSEKVRGETVRVGIQHLTEATDRALRNLLDLRSWDLTPMKNSPKSETG